VSFHSIPNIKHLVKPYFIDRHLNVSVLITVRSMEQNLNLNFPYCCNYLAEFLGTREDPCLLIEWYTWKHITNCEVILLLSVTPSQNVKFSFLILETYRFFAVVSLGGLPGKLFLGVIGGLSGGIPMVSMMILTECVLPRRASLSTLSVITWAFSGAFGNTCCPIKFLQGVHIDRQVDRGPTWNTPVWQARGGKR
jgi:hypothetical protein